jgi:hypothetical protein
MECTEYRGPWVIVSVPSEFVCELPDGYTVTLPAGDYFKQGSDREGTFWRHSKGILRSEKRGRSEDGGIYCPSDPSRPCLLWVRYSDPAASQPGEFRIDRGSVFGDRGTSYAGDVPENVGQQLRPHFQGK